MTPRIEQCTSCKGSGKENCYECGHQIAEDCYTCNGRGNLYFKRLTEDEIRAYLEREKIIEQERKEAAEKFQRDWEEKKKLQNRQLAKELDIDIIN